MGTERFTKRKMPEREKEQINYRKTLLFHSLFEFVVFVFTCFLVTLSLSIRRSGLEQK